MHNFIARRAVRVPRRRAATAIAAAADRPRRRRRISARRRRRHCHNRGPCRLRHCDIRLGFRRHQHWQAERWRCDSHCRSRRHCLRLAPVDAWRMPRSTSGRRTRCCHSLAAVVAERADHWWTSDSTRAENSNPHRRPAKRSSSTRRWSPAHRDGGAA